MHSVLLTIGTFDIPHAGHAAFLKRCEAFADTVYVGVNSDAFVREYKGSSPVFTESERMSLLRGMGYLTKLNDGPGRDLIDMIEPDVVAIGTDWARRDYFEQIATPVDYFEQRGIALVYVPYTDGISSTEIRRRLTP